MKRLIVFALVTVLVIGLALPAFAGGRRHRHATADIALGLASFAVFNQLFGTFDRPRPMVYERTIYMTTPTQVFYSPAPQVIYVEPAPPLAPVTASVVSYPHGRYELRQYGHHYQWVWIPNPPPPPAGAMNCISTGRYVKTAVGFVQECQ